MYSNKDKALDLVNKYREEAVTREDELKELEKLVAPPIVQEVILARRHYEDYRMRLGMALGMLGE